MKTQETQNHYKIIAGKLLLHGKQPDGDSVAFLADDVSHFEGVYRSHLLKPSAVDGAVQLRFEGIDAPELHYGSAQQPLGKASRDFLLQNLIRFQHIQYKTSANGETGNTVASSTPSSIDAYIATNGLEPHGRPISYVFPGKPAQADGSMVSLFPTDLKSSFNYGMLESGLAYLLTYSSMPQSHILFFREIAEKARLSKKGVWEMDTTPVFKLVDKSSVEGIEEGVQLIFPKLFRRSVDYFKAVDKGFDGDLTDWLHSKGEENDQVLLPGNITVPMSSLISQVNATLTFQANTNELIFIEK